MFFEVVVKVAALIPARMASTRFPGKPLADICGLPMIEHVRRRVQLCPLFDKVAVATCDVEIANVVRSFGGEAIMTADTHERCTDRIGEAVQAVKADIVVNVQGDEPFVLPAMFEALLKPLKDDPAIQCTNLMAEIASDEDFRSPNVVKTVCDLESNAIYYSREPIPSRTKAGGVAYRKYKQLGIIAFRYDYLLLFNSMPQTPLEKVESVDMMRAVEHGHKVRMVLSQHQSLGVDTPEDLERACALMREDGFFPQYLAGVR